MFSASSRFRMKNCIKDRGKHINSKWQKDLEKIPPWMTSEPSFEVCNLLHKKRQDIKFQTPLFNYLMNISYTIL